MKTINKLILLLFILGASRLFAQNDLSFGYEKPQTEIDTFVQKANGVGVLTAALQTADGGYVTSSSLYPNSFLVRKINASGQKQWEWKLNFQVVSDTALNSIVAGIAQTTDGGFILAGGGCSVPYFCSGLPGATLVKLHANGTVDWKKNLAVTFSGVASTRFEKVIATNDGGFIAIGGLRDVAQKPARNELLIVRFTATGDVVWGKNFGNFPDATAFSIPSILTADSGLIVAMRTPKSVDVMKVDISGDVVWKKLLTADDFSVQSVGTTADSGVILVGRTGTNSNKLKVIALTAKGTVSWKAAYSFTVPGTVQFVSSPIQTVDGGYAVTGSTYVESGKSTYGFIAKIDSSHKIAFQNSLGSGLASGQSIFATSDGGFFLFGKSGKILFVFKVNSEGLAPDCNFFQTLEPPTSIPFGPLGIADVNMTQSYNFTLESVDFGLTSVAANHPVTTLCQ